MSGQREGDRGNAVAPFGSLFENTVAVAKLAIGGPEGLQPASRQFQGFEFDKYVFEFDAIGADILYG